ncbi:MAG TPA: hypothetical protein PKY82_28890 [Pyrinomonadaceae bacterium]|nr:hypothetical protein [Pyrinomonadaceae bacterium]
MGSHGKKVEIDTSKGYEKNEIQLGGIVVTVIALFLTCVVSFWLMYILQNYMEASWTESEKQTANPMERSSKDKLPPEPRLQAAPGFGVDSPKGRINLELKPPQAEWQELQKIWKDQTENGQKVVENGKETVITLPIAEAKKQLLAQGVKGASDEKAIDEAISIYSGASAGRVASEKRK